MNASTRFLELMALPYRQFEAILGWRELDECVNKVFGADGPYTKLIPDLKGVDPDDAFSVIPYEKGATFLWYLEELVGGADTFEPFLRAYYTKLRAYYTKFMYKSITSDTFKEFFLEYFTSCEAVKKIDWETWFYSPGMPPYKPKFDDSLAVACHELAQRWEDWSTDTACPFDGSELKAFLPSQVQEFLMVFLTGKVLSLAALDKMEELYKLSESPNTEIVFRWIRVGIAARWEKCIPGAVKLVTEQGRMKFVRPVYRDLYGWEEKRQVAIDTFNANKDKMMSVAREMVAKDLHLA